MQSRVAATGPELLWEDTCFRLIVELFNASRRRLRLVRGLLRRRASFVLLTGKSLIDVRK